MPRRQIIRWATSIWRRNKLPFRIANDRASGWRAFGDRRRSQTTPAIRYRPTRVSSSTINPKGPFISDSTGRALLKILLG
jgi:hypothetical protein